MNRKFSARLLSMLPMLLLNFFVFVSLLYLCRFLFYFIYTCIYVWVCVCVSSFISNSKFHLFQFFFQTNSVLWNPWVFLMSNYEFRDTADFLVLDKTFFSSVNSFLPGEQKWWINTKNKKQNLQPRFEMKAEKKRENKINKRSEISFGESHKFALF